METLKGKRVHADELHFEHKLWASELNLCAEQLKVFQNRLEEVAQKNTNKDILIKVEQLQNQFIIQKNHIDKLLQSFKRDEHHLATLAQANTTAFDHRLFEDHEQEREEVNTFKSIYSAMKNEFYEFLAETL
jgi:hypothetical protein